MSDRILVDRGPEERSGGSRTGRPWPSVLLAGLLGVVGVAVVFGIGAGTDTGTPPPFGVPDEPFVVPSGTWSPLPFAGDGGFTAVATGPDGIVAVGTGRRVDASAFAWTSSDGTVWIEASGPWGSGDVLTSVVHTGAGYLAAGYRLDPASDDPTGAAGPTVWASADGYTWDRLAGEGLPPVGGMAALAVAGDDGVVAIGWEGPAVLEPLAPPAPGGVGRIWTSPDGLAWSDETPEGDGLWFTDLAVGGGVAAVSGADGAEPAVWTADGDGTWTRTGPPGGDGGVAKLASLVAPAGDGFLVVVRTRVDPHGLPAMWRVTGSGTWTRLDPENRPMAIGWIDARDGGFYAGAAFSRMFFPVAPELRASPDGSRWTEIEVTSGPGPWPPTIVTAIARFGDRLLAFGMRGGEAAGWELVPPNRP